MSEVKSCLSCEWCAWDWAGSEYMCERFRPEYPDACPLHSESDHNTNRKKKEAEV